MKIISISDERDLLGKLRDGDNRAFQEIYHLYARRLSSKLLQLLRSEELAADVLQDIFVKIWEMRESINPDQSFAALLYKMAANNSKNLYRRNVYDELMRMEMSRQDGYNPVEDAINQSDAKAMLSAALDKLTPRQREVYVLHKLEGYSYQEISEHLQISTSAINHHIQEANKQLKVLLKNYYPHLVILLLPALF